MIKSESFDNLLRQNPVARFEVARANQHSRPRRPSRIFAIIGVLLSVWILGVLIWMGLQKLPADLNDMGTIFEPLRRPVWILVSIALVFHFFIITRTLSVSMRATITRNHAAAWDALLMTGFDARRLVLGKWWAVLHIMWKQFLLLAIIRAGAIVATGAVLLNVDGKPLVYLNSQFEIAPVLGMSLAALCVFMLTLINAPFTAAAGVLASFFNRNQSPGMMTGFAVRMTAALLPVMMILPVIVFYSLTSEPGTAVDLPAISVLETFGLVMITMVDNGLLSNATLANPLDGGFAVFIPAAIISIMVYAILTWGLLRLAVLVAHRQGVAK